MKRTTLYSSSARTPRRAAASPPVAQEADLPALPLPKPPGRFRRGLKRAEKPLLLGAGALIVLSLVLTHAAMVPKPQHLTQDDIDNAVRHSLEAKPLPSWAAKAYEIVRPAVVKVRDYEAGEDGRDDIERGVGTGVVIVDKGIILTNLHVVERRQAHRRAVLRRHRVGRRRGLDAARERPGRAPGARRSPTT